MSLIIDALKKTQQLRLNGSEGSQILRYPYPKKKRERNSKKHWFVISAGLISFCILLFIFLRLVSSPLATQTNGTIVPMEKKPFVPVAEKTPSESPKEALNLPKDEDPLPANQALNPASGGTTSGQAGIQGPANVRAALSELPSHPVGAVGEKVSPPTQSSLNEKRGRSLVKQASPPLLPVTQKGEAPPKSIAVEQEGGKGHTLSSDVLNHFNSGVAFYHQKEFPKAIQAYRKVIEMDPTYIEAYNNLGIVYQTMGDLDGAFGAYQKSTEINPRYEKGYNNLGILFMLQGRYEEALEAFQNALAINPNNIESHISLGILFKKKGQWEKAIESYHKALAVDPLHRETHYNMALLYEQLENWELAIGHYQQFIQLSSKSHPELVLRVQRHVNALIKARGDK
jgi:Tfp pilus assembly protein PilF